MNLSSRYLRFVKLYIMRHGAAEDQSPSGRDEDRALTSSGRERVRAVARTLSELGEAPLSVLASPLVRALQTAEIVAVVTKVPERGRGDDNTSETEGASPAPPGRGQGQRRGRGQNQVKVCRELAPGGPGIDLVQSLLHANKKRVMLVGHEPDLSLLARLLIGEPIPIPLGRAMVVGLSAKTEGASLRFILDPKRLALSIDLRIP